MSPSRNDIITLLNRLDGVPENSSDRREIISSYARAWGVSESTIYRKIRKARGKLVKKFRVPDDDARHDAIRIAAIKQTMMDNGAGRNAGTQLIMDSLRGSGQLRSDASVATVNRIIKREGLLLPHPTVLVEPERVGQVYHMDFSFSTVFLLVERNGRKMVRVATPRERITTKKLRQKLEAQRIIIAQQIDGKSRLLMARYIPALGEDTALAINFSKNAWARREGDQNPFGGIPDELYTDNGSWEKTEMFRTFAAAYGFDVRTISPGRKWENGKAERTFRSIKNGLETFWLAPDKAGQEYPIEMIAQHLEDYVARYNSARHPRYRRNTRAQIWEQGRIECPPLYLDPTAKPEYRSMTRKVSKDGRLRLDNLEYYAGTQLAGHTVCVVISGNHVAIDDPTTGHRRQIKEYKPVKHGEKRMMPVSPARKEMYRLMGKDRHAHDVPEMTPEPTPLPNNIGYDTAGQMDGGLLRVDNGTDMVIDDIEQAYVYLSGHLGHGIGDNPELKQAIDNILYSRGASKSVCDEILHTMGVLV